MRILSYFLHLSLSKTIRETFSKTYSKFKQIPVETYFSFAHLFAQYNIKIKLKNKLSSFNIIRN